MLGEDGSTTSVSLGEDDFVEELDGRMFGACGLAFVNELVEHLCLAHHGDVVCCFTRYAADELIHIEVIYHACFSAFAGCRMHEATVGVE